MRFYWVRAPQQWSQGRPLGRGVQQSIAKGVIEFATKALDRIGTISAMPGFARHVVGSIIDHLGFGEMGSRLKRGRDHRSDFTSHSYDVNTLPWLFKFFYYSPGTGRNSEVTGSDLLTCPAIHVIAEYLRFGGYLE